jgi:hypothetical protein
LNIDDSFWFFSFLLCNFDSCWCWYLTNDFTCWTFSKKSTVEIFDILFFNQNWSFFIELIANKRLMRLSLKFSQTVNLIAFKLIKNVWLYLLVSQNVYFEFLSYFADLYPFETLENLTTWHLCDQVMDTKFLLFWVILNIS